MLSNMDNMQNLISGAHVFHMAPVNEPNMTDQAAVSSVRSQPQADAILSAHTPLAVLPLIAVSRPCYKARLTEGS